MNIPSLTTGTRRPLQVEMTPMIDVVFLLLIFFIWTTSFRVPEEQLPSRLAEPTNSGGSTQPVSEQVDFDPVIIRVAWQADQPAWQIGNRPAATRDEVLQRLTDVAAIKQDVPVIIDPTSAVPLGYVIDLYDMTRLIGFETVQFAADD